MSLGALPDSEPLSHVGAAYPFSGNGFRTGRPNRLRLWPGEPGKGVVRVGTEEFLVWGMVAGDPETTDRCTSVNGVGPLEHLSAAAAIMGILGWVLEAEHVDLPLFDGSAHVWAKAMEDLAREPLVSKHLELSPVSWNGLHRGQLEAQTASEFHLEVEWTMGPFGPERWEGTVSDLPGILGARTFIEAHDWWQARRQGLLRGVDPWSGRLLAGSIGLPDIALEELRLEGIEPRGRVWTGGDERMPNECAAHKALDLVGDIACAIGYLPALRIVARDAGHTLHARLGQALRHEHRDT